jgi:hypothetical protein
MPKYLSALYLTPRYTEEEENALHRGLLHVVQLRFPSCTSDAVLEMNMQSASSIAQKAVTPNKLKRARQACGHLPNQENSTHAHIMEAINHRTTYISCKPILSTPHMEIAIRIIEMLV